MNVVAIIPARGGSKRLPRKNILPLAGRPMISYPIGAALESGVFSTVIVSTEDAEIGEIAQSYGARVISRPSEFATDDAHELDACLHVLDVLAEEGAEPDAFCVIYPTAAFVAPHDLSDALALLDEAPAADVVMGVAGYPLHPYKALKEGDAGFLEMMYPVEAKMRSQFYPKLVASAGVFYWLRTESFRRLKTYYPEKLKGYEIPADRAVDIDTAEDLAWAERLKSLSAI